MRDGLWTKGLVIGIAMLFVGVSVLQQIQTPLKAGLTDGLIGYWNFNEGSGSVAHDSSGNGYDGNLYGATWTTGKYGSALEITNTSYVGDISSSFDNSITTAFTVAAWIKWYGPSSYPHNCIIFDGRGEPSLGQGFLFYIDPGSHQLGFWLNQDLPGSDILSISTLPIGSWTHVAVVFDHSSNVCRWYINGNLDNTHTIPNAYIQSPVQPFIGSNHWAPIDGNWAPLNGVLDEVRIYNRALSKNDIKQLCNQRLPANNPPNKPTTPTGPNTGIINTAYIFTTTTKDPNGNLVYYKWSWGDGSVSDWIGPYDSGILTNASHTWIKKGIYQIKVKAKDIFNAESAWSDTLKITISR